MRERSLATAFAKDQMHFQEILTSGDVISCTLEISGKHKLC